MTTVTPRTPPDASLFEPLEQIRSDFPILSRTVHGKPLVYLDNAATTQKPRSVIDAISDYYSRCNANVHRGVHRLAQEATEAYEQSRDRVARWINASDAREVVFVRGTTEGINLVAESYGRSTLQHGDEILLTQMEHHSNIVPWQLLARATGATLRVIPIDDHGQLELDRVSEMITGRTRIVAMVHISNSLGTINDVRQIADLAHKAGAVLVVDGAQGLPHQRVDMQALGCDFYAFSGHKMYGPMGIGALWGRAELLDDMPPYQGGGEMIKSVTFDETIYNDLPHKFEAGTPNVAGAVGLAAAVDYLEQVDIEQVQAREQALLARATEALEGIPEVRLIGTADRKTSVVSFTIEGIHPHDIGTVLDNDGIAVRTGHHCTQPVMERYGIPATTRASIGLYNTPEEIDMLADGLRTVIELLG
jgi:cysteine desulfurase/selenocysteine lyase